VRRDSQSRWSRPVAMTGLAGWLFADLLLVLFITAFAASTVPSAPPGSVRHLRPLRSATPHQPVLILSPHVFTLSVPAQGIVGTDGSTQADLALATELEGDLRAQHLTSARAGLVEAFGSSPSPTGDGTAVAAAADHAITRNLPLFATAYQQPFWEAGSDGTVTLRVFFFARQ
jgi:hypothetical protein